MNLKFTSVLPRTLTWLITHPLLVLIPLVLAVGLLGLWIPALKLDFSPPLAEHPEYAAYQQALTTFGPEVQAVVVVRSHSGHVFTKEALTLIDALSSAITTISDVSAVQSLTTVSTIKGGKGFVRIEPLVNMAVLEPKNLAQIKETVLSTPMWPGTLVSEDGKSAAMLVYTERDARISGAIDAIVAEHADNATFDVYQVGIPLFQSSVYALLPLKLILFFALAVLSVCGLIWGYYRSRASLVLPLAASGFSVLATLGLSALLGYSLNPLTIVLVPLILTLACTESGRMVLSYSDEIKAGRSKPEALLHALRHDGLPFLLTALTFALGCAVFGFSSSLRLKQFGIVAPASLLLHALLTILLVPAIGRYVFSTTPQTKHTRQFFLLQRIGMLIDWYERRRKMALGIMVILLLLAVAGLFRIHADFTFITREAFVKKQLVEFRQDFAGPATFNIIVETGQKNRVQEPEVLRQLEALQAFLDDTDWCDASTSFADYLRLLHREMNGGRPEMHVLPGSRELVAQYLLLLNSLDLSHYVNSDFSTANIVLRYQPRNSQHLASGVEAIEEYVQTHFSSDLSVSITGHEIVSEAAARTLINTQFQFSALAVVVIFLVLSGVFLSFKIGLIALCPPLIAVLVHFGVMGWLSIPLTQTTVSLTILAFGVALSTMLHFFIRYQERLMELNDQNLAVGTTIYHEGEAVLLTSAGLVLGFGLFLFSGLSLTIHLGLMSALAMLAALVNVFFINPRLLDVVQIITVWDFIRVHIHERVLRESILFKHLRRSQMKKVILLGSIRSVAAQETVMRQGETGEDMYLVLDGKMRVNIAEDEHNEKTIHTLESGSIVGEMALLGEQQRSATVTALETSTLLRINQQTLQRVKSSFPRIAAQLYCNMAAILSDRLRNHLNDRR